MKNRLLLLVTVLAVGIFLVYNIYAKGTDSEDYMVVTVEKGETLWSIAQRYNVDDKMDPRSLISKIKKINNLDSPLIYPGDKLLIPTST